MRKSNKKGKYAFDKLTSGRDDYDKKDNSNMKTDGAELGDSHFIYLFTYLFIYLLLFMFCL